MNVFVNFSDFVRTVRWVRVKWIVFCTSEVLQVNGVAGSLRVSSGGSGLFL